LIAPSAVCYADIPNTHRKEDPVMNVAPYLFPHAAASSSPVLRPDTAIPYRGLCAAAFFEVTFLNRSPCRAGALFRYVALLSQPPSGGVFSLNSPKWALAALPPPDRLLGYSVDFPQRGVIFLFFPTVQLFFIARRIPGAFHHFQTIYSRSGVGLQETAVGLVPFVLLGIFIKKYFA
jgi:hypothetical protein